MACTQTYIQRHFVRRRHRTNFLG